MWSEIDEYSGFTKWLNQKIESNKIPISQLLEDGVGGPKTRDAIYKVFSCTNAKTVTEAQLLKYAQQLGDTSTQRLKAIARIEKGTNAWTRTGLPRILYERHYFYKFVKKIIHFPHTKNQFLAKENWGGYNNQSWEKLAHAACIHPIGAFSSVSMSTFQVLGIYYKELNFATPLDMLYVVSRDEAVHYQLLVGYILKIAKIKNHFLKISKNPETNQEFARRYNGPNFAKHNYHGKLAQAMK